MAAAIAAMTTSGCRGTTALQAETEIEGIPDVRKKWD